MVKNGFKEFVKVEWNSSTDDTPNVSGFSIELFFAVRDALPFPLSHEFIPQRQINGTYSQIPYKINTKVGDPAPL